MQLTIFFYFFLECTILATVSFTAKATEPDTSTYPFYNNTNSAAQFNDNGGDMFIGRVDLPNQLNAYNNVLLRRVTADTWKLINYTADWKVPVVNNVEVIMTDSFPMQVLLKVTGNTDTCSYLTNVNVNTGYSFFEVELHTKTLAQFCQQEALLPFIKYVALPVYELGAGTYSYFVNNGSISGKQSKNNTGTFTLKADNKYADDCGYGCRVR